MTNLTPLALRLSQAHAAGGWEAVARVVEEMVGAAVADDPEYNRAHNIQFAIDASQSVIGLIADGDLLAAHHELERAMGYVGAAMDIDAGKELGA
jgi:hypothetical protein